MYFQQIQVGGFDNNFSYIVGDEETKNVAVIDPLNIPLLTKKLQEENLNVKAIFITHGHPDHYGETANFYNKLNTKPTIYLHPAVKPKINLKDDEDKAFHELQDNETIQIDSLTLKTIFTPGHEPGSICILAENKLFTGDTLFVSTCGRTDLAGSSVHDLYDSLFNKICQLPDDTIIYPGHDYGKTPFATLAYLKEHNKYLKCKTEEEFVKLRMA